MKQTKSLKNQIKKAHPSIKVLFLVMLLTPVALFLPESPLGIIISLLLLPIYPALAAYFIIAKIVSVINDGHQKTKELKQYLNRFKLTNISLKKGILSFTINKRIADEQILPEK